MSGNEITWKSKLAVIDVPDSTPFKNDLLGRESCADTLTSIINSEPGPYVLAIDASWGRGKTTFLRMWSQSLRNDDYLVINFNAWETDFARDPFVAVFSELKDQLKLDDGFFNKLKESVPQIKEAGFNVLLKMLSAGQLSVSDFTGSELRDSGEATAGTLVDAYHGAKSLREQFKNVLAESVKGKSCVFIVDELDRCRPDFAVKLLENIKHLFDVPGIIFVLSMDKEQLGHALRTVYGQEMSVDGYLRRFIDLEYVLPDPDTSSFVEAIGLEYGLVSYLGQRPGGNDDWGTVKTFVSLLAESYALSLRDIEHLLRRLALACRTTKPDLLLYSHAMLLLITVRMKDLDLYYKCCNRKVSPRTLMEPFDPIFKDRYHDFNHTIHYIEGMMLFLMSNDANGYADGYRQKVIDLQGNTDDAVYKLYKPVIELCDRIKQRDSFGSTEDLLENLIEKIELTQQFVF